jgi:hypothetical protein
MRALEPCFLWPRSPDSATPHTQRDATRHPQVYAELLFLRPERLRQAIEQRFRFCIQIASSTGAGKNSVRSLDRPNTIHPSMVISAIGSTSSLLDRPATTPQPVDKTAPRTLGARLVVGWLSCKRQRPSNFADSFRLHVSNGLV